MIYEYCPYPQRHLLTSLRGGWLFTNLLPCPLLVFQLRDDYSIGEATETLSRLSNIVRKFLVVLKNRLLTFQSKVERINVIIKPFGKCRKNWQHWLHHRSYKTAHPRH